SNRWPTENWSNHDAGERAERIRHANGSGYADGPAVSQLLDTGPTGKRACRAGLPAGARSSAIRETDRLSGCAGPSWTDRRVLCPSPRLSVVRPQRREWHPLPVSRLEIRRDGTMHGNPVRARGQHALPAYPDGQLSADREGRHPLDLYGSGGSQAASA